MELKVDRLNLEFYINLIMEFNNIANNQILILNESEWFLMWLQLLYDLVLS